MTAPRSALLLAFLALALVPAACGGGDDGPTEGASPATDTGAAEPTPEPGTETHEEAPAATGALEGTQTLVAGDVGEVDFRVSDGVLELAGVRPASGWNHVIDEQDRDEIDIDFRSEGREVELKLGVDDGGRKLDVDLEYETGAPSGPQTMRVGDVGEIDYEARGDSLRVLEVRPGDGWTHSVEEDDDDIEVDFRHDNGLEVEVEIDLDDDD